MGKSAINNDNHDTVVNAMSARLEAEFSDADPKLLSLLRMLMAENAAIRSSITDLRHELHAAHALADRDPLCPVLNRRAFLREMEREIARCQRHQRSLSMLYIDLDKFKTVNDSYGHEAGDRILINMSKTLRSAVRKTDIVSRLGGDEFGILLIETGEEHARACAKALNDRIRGENIGVTASIGYATWQHRSTADELMAAADRRMFIIKNSDNTPN